MMTNINIKNIETRQPTNLVIHKEKMKKERDKEVKKSTSVFDLLSEFLVYSSK
jgi:hypothetical protein